MQRTTPPQRRNWENYFVVTGVCTLFGCLFLLGSIFFLLVPELELVHSEKFTTCTVKNINKRYIPRCMSTNCLCRECFPGHLRCSDVTWENRSFSQDNLCCDKKMCCAENRHGNCLYEVERSTCTFQCSNNTGIYLVTYYVLDWETNYVREIIDTDVFQPIMLNFKPGFIESCSYVDHTFLYFDNEHPRVSTGILLVVVLFSTLTFTCSVLCVGGCYKAMR